MKGKYTNMRKMIWNKLGDGTMNTVQIKEFINTNSRHGINAGALGNILSKHPEFEHLGDEKMSGITGSTYKVMIWGRK